MEKSKLSIFEEKLEEANSKHLQEIQKFKDKITNIYENDAKILNVLAWSSIVLDAAVVKVTDELLTSIRLQLKDNLSQKKNDEFYDRYKKIITERANIVSNPLSKSSSVMHNLTNESEHFVYSQIARAMKSDFVFGFSF
jgi:phosphoheptose isomerase